MTLSQTEWTKAYGGARQLNRLIEVCFDAEKDYALAAADVRETPLKHLFLQRERERASFVTALQRVVREIGAFPENEGSGYGAAHRAWSAIVRAVRSNDARTILEQCVESDELAIATYDDVLASGVFRGNALGIQSILQRQRAIIQHALIDLRQRARPH